MTFGKHLNIVVVSGQITFNPMKQPLMRWAWRKKASVIIIISSHHISCVGRRRIGSSATPVDRESAVRVRHSSYSDRPLDQLAKCALLSTDVTHFPMGHVEVIFLILNTLSIVSSCFISLFIKTITKE